MWTKQGGVCKINNYLITSVAQYIKFAGEWRRGSQDPAGSRQTLGMKIAGTWKFIDVSPDP